MKKTKLLIPLFTIASIGSLTTTLVSCGKNNKVGNLMTEFTPTIAPEEAADYTDPMAVIDHYLDACSKNTEIFKEDLMYTLSRGMPQFQAYISEFCEVKDFDSNIEISNIQVNTSKSIGGRQISFDAEMHTRCDLSGTKKEELEWYLMKYQKIDTVTKANFVFDFNASEFNTYDILGQRRQMTTFAGATQFGISEKNSTVQLISQKGTAVDLDGKEIEIDTTTVGNRCHFILPSYEYWNKHGGAEGGLATYYKNYAEVWDVWQNYGSIQTIVLTLKYYMPANTTPASDDTLKSFDFGSYYMKNASLKNVYTYGSASLNPNMLYGFNLSLDSTKTRNNILNYRTESGYDDSDTSNRKLVLPSNSPSGAPIVDVAQNAFNGNISEYTNIGIPNIVDELVIPNSYEHFYENCFDKNESIKKITFQRSANHSLVFYDESFSELINLETIDFSMFLPDEYINIHSVDSGLIPLHNIHAGKELQVGVAEGTVIIPHGSDVDDWKSMLTAIGLTPLESAPIGGWNVKVAEE